MGQCLSVTLFGEGQACTRLALAKRNKLGVALQLAFLVRVRVARMRV
jgi:hypothetical protein